MWINDDDYVFTEAGLSRYTPCCSDFFSKCVKLMDLSVSCFFSNVIFKRRYIVQYLLIGLKVIHMLHVDEDGAMIPLKDIV